MSSLKFIPILLLAASAPAFGYGAIAVDVSDPSLKPAYGYSIDYPDRESAEKAAVEYCRQYADKNADCRSMVWFEKCGAYVNSRENYGYGYGSTKEGALEAAFEECNKLGEECSYVFAVCQKG